MLNNSAKNFYVPPPKLIATGLPPHRGDVVRRLAAHERKAVADQSSSKATVLQLVKDIAGKAAV